MLDYWAYRMTQQACLALPPETAYRWAERLADARWRCARRVRDVVSRNLALVLSNPAQPPSGRVREVFRSFARYLVEFFNMHRADRTPAALEGYAHVEEAARAGRGVIVLTAHLGNWELGAAVLRRLGHPVAAVALPHRDVRVNGLFNRQREACGIRVIPTGAHAAQHSLRALREGAMLGLLGDADFGQDAMAVAVGHAQLAMPRGPAVLSFRAQAPVVPTFLVREGPWRFKLCCEPPIWPERHQAAGAWITRAMRAYAAAFERYLLRYPDQWLMFRPVAAAG